MRYTKIFRLLWHNFFYNTISITYLPITSISHTIIMSIDHEHIEKHKNHHRIEYPSHTKRIQTFSFTHNTLESDKTPRDIYTFPHGNDPPTQGQNQKFLSIHTNTHVYKHHPICRLGTDWPLLSHSRRQMVSDWWRLLLEHADAAICRGWAFKPTGGSGPSARGDCVHFQGACALECFECEGWEFTPAR